MIAKKLINRYNELKIASLTGLQLQMGGDINQPVVVGGFPHSSLTIPLQDEQKERHIREIIRVEIQKL